MQRWEQRQAGIRKLRNLFIDPAEFRRPARHSLEDSPMTYIGSQSDDLAILNESTHSDRVGERELIVDLLTLTCQNLQECLVHF